LTRQAAARGWPVLIVSSDKDLAQLVNGQVRLLDTMKNVITDAAGVEEKFGVPPTRIVDWLALVGDASDNIPGVSGVGKVTAAKWLSQYGSLDALIADAAHITGKIGDKLRAGLAQLPLVPTSGNAGLQRAVARYARRLAARDPGYCSIKNIV
jgi:DNA polymerase-1